MRLFVAIEIPEDLREALSEHCRRLAPNLPQARWVPADRIHLTLVFLGETDDLAGDAVGGVLDTLGTRHTPLSLRVAGAGVFPVGRPSKVAWVGLDASPELLALQRGLQETLFREIGKPPDNRPYHPHLTMARCKRPWPRRAAELWCQEAPPALGDSFEVTYVDLMRSRLTPTGPRHSILRRVALRG